MNAGPGKRRRAFRRDDTAPAKRQKPMWVLNVLYEDNHILVVQKPYGVPSQADGSGDDDMLSRCKAYIKEKYGKPGDVYIGLVHRLDRPARGIMVFARTSKAAARLSEQIKNGGFEKTYLAVLTKAPEQDTGEIWDFLYKDESTRTARVVGEETEGAKKAGLEYEVLGSKDGLCLVRVKLLTGRFHQIRAQFAHRGCALFGDMKYGSGEERARLALFSCGLSFTHPTKGERLEFKVEPTGYPFTLFEL